jgi:hypothetical protein
MARLPAAVIKMYTEAKQAAYDSMGMIVVQVS